MSSDPPLSPCPHCQGESHNLLDAARLRGEHPFASPKETDALATTYRLKCDNCGHVFNVTVAGD